MSSILKCNTYQDANGNALFSSDGSGNVTGNNLLKPAFEAYRSGSDQNISDLTATKIQFNSESFDTDGCYDNTTNYRFTPTVAGKYYVYAKATYQSPTGEDLHYAITYIYKNGSGVTRAMIDNANSASGKENAYTVSVNAVLDMNGSTDYIEIYAEADSSVAGNVNIKSNAITWTTFGAYRIIGA